MDVYTSGSVGVTLSHTESTSLAGVRAKCVLERGRLDQASFKLAFFSVHFRIIKFGPKVRFILESFIPAKKKGIKIADEKSSD